MTEITHEEEIETVEEPIVDDVVETEDCVALSVDPDDEDEDEDEAEEAEEEDEDDEEDDDEEDEDELKDPIIAERKKCVDSFDCMGFKHAFNACQSRVTNEGAKESCTPEYFDLLECRDKCVSQGHLFHVLNVLY
eukprot:sb/3474692/